ncbi:MAG: hypothetical protein KKC03_05640 [Bacteroidetes bacterium]|nr:hypothetical protein [Bacteroidota bacterium]
MQKPVFIGFLLLISSYGLAQKPSALQGYVMIDSLPVGGVTILNLTQNTTAKSNEYGFYVIKAKPTDTLIISSSSTGTHRYFLLPSDFEKPRLETNLSIAVNLLKEVEVTEYKSINAISLGIIPADFKKYTPAEKEVDAATNWNFSGPEAHAGRFYGVGGSFSFDPVLNFLSGRTKKLRENLATERKYHDFVRVQSIYRDAYYIETLKIPEEKIAAFQYFLADDLLFMNAVRSKNQKMLNFWSLELANRFKKLNEN